MKRKRLLTWVPLLGGLVVLMAWNEARSAVRDHRTEGVAQIECPPTVHAQMNFPEKLGESQPFYPVAKHVDIAYTRPQIQWTKKGVGCGYYRGNWPLQTKFEYHISLKSGTGITSCTPRERRLECDVVYPGETNPTSISVECPDVVGAELKFPEKIGANPPFDHYHEQNKPDNTIIPVSYHPAGPISHDGRRVQCAYRSGDQFNTTFVDYGYLLPPPQSIWDCKKKSPSAIECRVTK